MEQKRYYHDPRYGEMRRGAPYVQNARLSVEPQDCPCEQSDCGSDHIRSKQLFMPAMAYVPDHEFDNLLPVETGFCAGTIFGCLHLPFTGKEVR